MHFSADCKNGGGENRAGKDADVFSGVFVLPIRLLDRQDVFEEGERGQAWGFSRWHPEKE